MPERNIDVRVRLKGADTFKQGMSGVEQSMGWLDVAKGILGSQIIQRGFDMIAKAISGSIDESVKFESAMAGLRKTAGLSETALGIMEGQIMALSERVPMAATDIAELADTVAHLGLQKDQILPFTEVMIALGEATDMSAEEAATALAQLANIMGTSTEDYERLGSSIFELGRTSATTESAIVEMTSRLAAAGKLAGMNEADVLAFAAALSSVGVEAASGGTTIQKLVNTLQIMTVTGGERLEAFARVAGMSADEFVKAWESDPAMAIAALIDGLGDIGESGGNVAMTLQELGITEVRMSRNIASLASANDLLDRSLENSRNAWKENTTLAEATGIAYGTTASKLQMAENAITNAQIAVGDNLKDTKLGIKELEAAAAKGLRDLIMDDGLDKQIEDITGRYDAVGQSLTTAREQATVMVEMLAELGDPSQLDAEGLQQYETVLEALNRVFPGIINLYDQQTNSLAGGASALQDYVDGQYELANSANEVARSSEQMEAYTEKMERLKELQTQEALALAELQAAQAAYDEYSETATAQEMWDSDELRRLDEAKETYDQIAKAEREAADYLEEYSWIADDAINASEGLADAMDAVGTSADAQGADVEQLERKLTSMQQTAEQILAEFEEELEAAQKRVDSVFGDVWSSGAPKIEGTEDDPGLIDTSEFLSSMDEQIKYAEEYAALLKQVQDLGLSTDLLSTLTDGSAQSKQVLESLVADNGESIDELNAKYAEVGAAKDEMAVAMAEAATDASARMAEVEDAVNKMVEAADQSSSAESNAASTIQGLISGIDSKISSLRLRVNQVNNLMSQLDETGGGGGDGSHAMGLSYVPFDGYLAQLHRGEMVLTALEAKAYRAEQFASFAAAPQARSAPAGGSSQTVTNNFNFGDIHTARESDIDRLSRELCRLSKRERRLRGASA